MDRSRKDPRAVVTLTARYRSPTAFEYVHEKCYDLSAGGMFIKSPSPAPAGTLLKLECEVEREGGKTQLIRGVARVVWQRDEADTAGQPAGMGVKFVKLDPGSREVVEAVLEQVGTRPGSVEERRAERSQLADEAEEPPVKVAPQSMPTLAEVRPVRPDEAAAPDPSESGDDETGLAQGRSAGRRTDPEFRSAPPESGASAGRGPLDRTLVDGTRDPLPASPPEPLRETAASPPPAAAPAGDGEDGEEDEQDDPEWRARRLRELVAAQAQPRTVGTRSELGPPGPIITGAPPPQPRFSSKQVLVGALAVLGGVVVVALLLRGPPEESRAEATAPLSGDHAEQVPSGLEPDPAPDTPQVPPPAEEASPDLVGQTVGQPPDEESAEESTEDSTQEVAGEAPEEAASAPGQAASREPSPKQRAKSARRERVRPEPAETPAPPSGEEQAAQEPRAAPDPPAPDKPSKSPMEEALACLSAGDNGCVVAALAGKADSPRELELLIETYRAMGQTAKAEPVMERYVKRFPQERRANNYRRMLERREGELVEPERASASGENR